MLTKKDPPTWECSVSAVGNEEAKTCLCTCSQASKLMPYGLKAIYLILFSSHRSYQSRRRSSQYFNKKLKYHRRAASALANTASSSHRLTNTLPFPAEIEPLWQHRGQVMGWQIRYQELTFIPASPQTEKSQFLHQLMGKRQNHVKAALSFLHAGKTKADNLCNRPSLERLLNYLIHNIS